MSNQYGKYENYGVTDFVLDGDFIDWVKAPGKQNDLFWQQVMSVYPEQTGNITQARKLILSINASSETPSEETKDRIWKDILNQSQGGHVVKMNTRKYWMAAAAIIAISLVAIWIFNTRNHSKEQLTETSSNQIEKDFSPGGNRAILTLSNGSTINLDSAENGTLATQGTTKIVKLEDGRVAYQTDASALNPGTAFNTITTPRGGQYRLVLDDGTRVWLNAASSIKYPAAFEGNERRVTITGEAYFEVAHNANKPFIVKVNMAGKESEVRVLGTHFNVNAYEDENAARTTLLEGSVRVSNEKGNILISPGQQAVTDLASGQISINRNVDVEQVVAWKNGYFQFDNSTIQEIMRQVSRWYNVDVVYKGKIPSGHYVGKPSRTLNLLQILKVIKYSGVSLEVENNKIVVSE